MVYLVDVQVVRGMVIKRESEGSIKLMEDAKVVAYAQVRYRCLSASSPCTGACMCVLVMCNQTWG